MARVNSDAPVERIALVLGGGAPTLTLQAGALLALDEEGVEFDVVSTSGAGMLIGLLYAAARHGDRREALRATVHLGVHDAIYRWFPINYKVFYKPGPLARQYFHWMMPILNALPHDTDEQRLLKDWLHLWLVTFSPSSMTADSLGMCEPAPWLEEVVDFERLKAFEPEFYINAWNIRERAMRVFAKEEITPAHFRAALAFPMIYPPFELDGDLYIEGSAMDTLNLGGLLRYDKAYDQAYPVVLERELLGRWPAIDAAWRVRATEVAQGLVQQAQAAAHAAALRARVAEKAPAAALQEAALPFTGGGLEAMRRNPLCRKALEAASSVDRELNSISKIVVFDVLGTDQLVRRPRNLYDAWVLQMIVPLVSISANDLELFQREYDYAYEDARRYLHRIRFADEISHDQWTNVLDWSYGNLSSLFHAGYRAGKKFFAAKPWLQERAAAVRARRAAVAGR